MISSEHLISEAQFVELRQYKLSGVAFSEIRFDSGAVPQL